MRLASLLASLLGLALLAGCATPAATTGPDDALDAFVPWDSEGGFWVGPSNSQAPTRVEVPFAVNGTGRTVRVEAAISEQYAGVGLPRSTAQMEVQLLDAAGEVVAQVVREPAGEPIVTLETTDLPEGAATLVFLLRGGSDGQANGDHVGYRLTVE